LNNLVPFLIIDKPFLFEEKNFKEKKLFFTPNFFTHNYNFQEYDEDKSSRVGPDEVKAWLGNHGKYITMCQAQRIVKIMDFDKDGHILYHDFLVFITARLLTLRLC